MRIGLDVRYLSHGLLGGVRSVVHALATELPRVAPHHEFVYYADTKAPLELPNVPPNVRVRTLPWRNTLSSIINDAALGRHAEADGLDVFHAPANVAPTSRVPVVLLVHDALNLFPMSEHLRGFGSHPRKVAMMMYLGRQTRQSLRRAAHIVTPSEYSRRDIAERASLPPDRFTVVPLAATEQFRVMPRRDLAITTLSHNLSGRYVIADGIKNPEATIAAYRALPDNVRNTVQLAFFSREAAPRPAVAAAIQEFGNTRIRFIARPPVNELVELMSGATALLFPSFFEGFGLPIVEAMRCGLPIVASSRGSIPEVLGDAGLTADIDAPGAFEAQVVRLLTDDDLRLELARRSLARGRTFTWRSSATKILSVFERFGQQARRAS